MAVPILFVHYGEEWIRGSERCLLDLLAHLDRERFTPLLWCNRETLAAEARRLGVETLVESFPILLGWEAPRLDLAGWLRLLRHGWRLIRRHRIQLIHANSGAPCQWMVPLARYHRLPLLAHLHARYLPRERYTLGLHQVSLAVGVSGPVVAGLIEDGMPPSRTRVIHNGIDLPRLAAARRPPGGGGDPVLVTVGSLIRRKGIDLLIDALALLRRDGVAARLLVVGEGGEREALRRQARRLGLADAVHLLGERQDVGRWLAEADLFVSGAREEVFGLVLAEAGAMGLPVVAPGVGGIPEVVGDGESGLLVAPERPEALAAAILRLLRRPELARRLGEEGRRRVVERFGVERYVGAFQEVYDGLLANRDARLGWGDGVVALAGCRRWLGGVVGRRLGRTEWRDAR